VRLQKITGINFCEDLCKQYGCDAIILMPISLDSSGYNYHPTHSDLTAPFIRCFHEGEIVGNPSLICWGIASPLRECLHADEPEEACLHLLYARTSELQYLPIRVRATPQRRNRHESHNQRIGGTIDKICGLHMKKSQQRQQSIGPPEKAVKHKLIQET
jgi:hypothetical protein